MKHSIFTLLMMLLPSCVLSDTLPELNRVEQLLWKNRLILVWSDEPMSAEQILTKSKYDMDDRHILWFILHKQKVVSNYKGVITHNFVTHTNNTFAKLDKKVILIGKDGGVKHVDTELNLDTLFSKIDTMPMRINEMEKIN